MRTALTLLAFLVSSSTAAAKSAPYVNHEYGYSVEVPSGARIIRTQPPGPQHGIGIIVPGDGELEVWVDGSYDATSLGSVDAIAQHHLETIVDAGGEILSAERAFVRLGGLAALRVTIKNRPRGSTAVVFEEHVVALRASKKGEPGIIYDLSVRVPETQRGNAEAQLGRLVSSWKVLPLPRP